jgi:hypothetical protein|tara:strand:- start:298 stop:480 length:183 start_codon:yes stop_codon:yes gene_type:complete
MTYKSFQVSFTIKVDEDGNILSLVEDEQERDVEEVISNALHDIDDVQIEKIKVRGKDYGR